MELLPYSLKESQLTVALKVLTSYVERTRDGSLLPSAYYYYYYYYYYLLLFFLIENNLY